MVKYTSTSGRENTNNISSTKRFGVGNGGWYNARMALVERVEGVLFYRAEPMKISALARFFSVTEEEVRTALTELGGRLENGGLKLITTDTEVELTTAPELADTIEGMRKDELKRDIGKAGAETLAIVLYRGPVSRAEIDRIRGVNSAFILRNLLIRGLVERRDNPKDQRSFLYAGTPELFAHLGVTKRESLPDFARTMDALDAFERAQKDEAAMTGSATNTTPS